MTGGASDAVLSSVSGLQGELVTIGGAAIVVSAVVFGLTKGWGVFRRLVK